MSQLVIDASVAIAAIPVEDRTQEARDIVRRAVAGLVVPFLWPVEVGNVLLLGERRGRFSAERLVAHMRYLAAMPVTVDHEGPNHAWSATMELARRHRLTVYDAAYLELAVRLRVPLATFDAALARAAGAEGVTLA